MSRFIRLNDDDAVRILARHGTLGDHDNGRGRGLCKCADDARQQLIEVHLRGAELCTRVEYESDEETFPWVDILTVDERQAFAEKMAEVAARPDGSGLRTTLVHYRDLATRRRNGYKA